AMSAGAKTAPVAAVPKTRMEPQKKSPAAGAAPVAVAKKSMMVPMLAGVAVVAAAGFFVVKPMLTTPDPLGPDTSVVGAATTGDTTTRDTTPATNPGGVTPMSNPVNPGTNSPRNEPQ